MTAMISAELLRLRTVRSHLWFALVLIVLVAANAAPFLNGAPTTTEDVELQIRGLVLISAVGVAAYSAYVVAEEFKRGAVAMTYLVHPARSRVTLAQTITYAAVSAAFAVIAAGVALAIALPVAAGEGIATGFGSADIALVIAGSAVGGAVLGAAGALVGVATRHSGAAMTVVIVWNFAETFATGGGTRDGVGSYLPFQLVGAAAGLSDDVAALPAMALLIAELALLALAVRRWALRRDLT
jgi:hypothetical protein